MSLSNTAVPRYYGHFRQQVMDSLIPVCETISMEMNRIDALIQDPKIYYDESKVEGFIQFCENELTLTDGTDLHLLDTFKLWAEQIFGWYYFIDMKVYEPYKTKPGGRYVTKKIKKRLINKMFLIIARGAAKSMFLSCIQAYFLINDRTTTQQITTAPTMAQADEVMAPLRTAILRRKGPVFQFLTMGSINNTTGSFADRQKLCSTKKGIQNFLNGSIIMVKPMSIDKLQGSRCKIATVDEWLSCDIREDVIGTIEQGASKTQGSIFNDDYLIVAASSEGTVRNGPGDTIKMELMNILKGDYVNPHVSIWYYKLDDKEEVGLPEMWIKAQPNLGKTVQIEAYIADINKMEQNPTARNDILAKRFNLPVEGFTYFFTYEETEPHPIQDFWNMPCSMGVDLSQGNDFTAFTFLFPLKNGGFGVKTRCYITGYTYANLHQALRAKYEEFVMEGSLIVMDGPYFDMNEVYDDLDNYIIESRYDVRCIGYDTYNARQFIERWERENGERGIEKVIQGRKTESVPLGEIKNLANQRMLYFDQSLMTFCMGNCIVMVDHNGNRMIFKDKREQKIDSVAALMDAWVSYKANIDEF